MRIRLIPFVPPPKLVIVSQEFILDCNLRNCIKFRTDYGFYAWVDRRRLKRTLRMLHRRFPRSWPHDERRHWSRIPSV